MKSIILAVGLVLSFNVLAETPVFTMFYKTGFISSEYAVTKTCTVYEDLVETATETADEAISGIRSIEADPFWSDLIDEAAQGELTPNPFSTSFVVEEFYAYKNGEKIVLKGVDSSNETVINESESAKDLIQIITKLCVAEE